MMRRLISMYLTHTFAHRETLSRAHSWLTQHGFSARRFRADASGVARLVVEDEPQRLAAAKILISAAERADPDGAASFWDQAPRSRLVPKDDREDTHAPQHGPHSWVLGWHPID
jgi:hypothetical protein